MDALLKEIARCPRRVDSGRLADSYIRVSCTSEFGATTDVRQAAGCDFWLEAVLTLSATNGPTAQCKTAPEGAAVDGI